MTNVLILSSLDDPHATGVADLLGEMDVNVDFCSLNDLLDSQLLFTFAYRDDSKRIKIGEQVLDLSTYFSIWHRRPGALKPKNFVEPWIANMVAREATSAFDGVMRSLSCLWVNYPPHDNACLYKLWQLRMAEKVGFAIPETIVTNNPQEVREFFDYCGGQVVYKMISEGTSQLMPKEEVPAGIPTLLLREEDLQFIEQVSCSPHLFQRCISKKYELRITVVGKQVFAAKIDSQSGSGTIDWRNDYTVPMEPYELPPAIYEKCLELTRALRLNYGAIDMIVSDTGDYIFLEINCAGQYKWLETRMDIPISKALASLLAGKSEPLIAAPI